jgi:hypothetical protein
LFQHAIQASCAAAITNDTSTTGHVTGFSTGMILPHRPRQEHETPGRILVLNMQPALGGKRNSEVCRYALLAPMQVLFYSGCIIFAFMFTTTRLIPYAGFVVILVALSGSYIWTGAGIAVSLAMARSGGESTDGTTPRFRR